jgi:chromosome segregation ATPase
LKRDNQSDLAEKQRIEIIKRKLEHFQTRYMELYKAIGFAKQKKSQIKAQIDEFTKL